EERAPGDRIAPPVHNRARRAVAEFGVPPAPVGPRKTGTVAPVRCAVHQPTPKTKTSSPDPDRSAISRSSSLAGSLISAAWLIWCPSPAGASVVGNTALRRIDTRPSGGPTRPVGLPPCRPPPLPPPPA